MEVRLKFVVGNVEVEIITGELTGLTGLIKDVAQSVKDALEAEVIPKLREPRGEPEPPIVLAGTIRDRIGYLANQVQSDEDGLRRVIHFGDDSPVVIQAVGGNTRTEQQRRALLILGTVLDLVYERPEVGIGLYGELLRKSNVPEQRLDVVMPTLRGRFISKGAGRATSYEITVPGRNDGLALLRELVAGSSGS